MHCVLDISLKDIQKNWKILNKLSYNNASAVVKANAYGFGLIEISEAAKYGSNNMIVLTYTSST